MLMQLDVALMKVPANMAVGDEQPMRQPLYLNVIVDLTSRPVRARSRTGRDHAKPGQHRTGLLLVVGEGGAAEESSSSDLSRWSLYHETRRTMFCLGRGRRMNTPRLRNGGGEPSVRRAFAALVDGDLEVDPSEPEAVHGPDRSKPSERRPTPNNTCLPDSLPFELS
jgi:hypothetical protein